MKSKLYQTKYKFWKTIKNYIDTKSQPTQIGYFKAVSHWCGHLDIEECGSDYSRFLSASSEEGLSFVSYLKEQKGKPSRSNPGDVSFSINTIKKNVSLLRTLYGYLVAVGVAQNNPFSLAVFPKLKARANKRPTRAVPYDKIHEILKNCRNPMERALVSVLFASGLRRSEAIGLKIGDIIREGDRLGVVLSQTKNGDCGIVQPVGKLAHEYIDSYLAEIDTLSASEKLFPVSSTTVYNIFKRACEPVLGDGYSPHSARATAITKVLKTYAGDYRKAQKFGRHKSVDSTKLYDGRMMPWYECGADALD